MRRRSGPLLFALIVTVGLLHPAITCGRSARPHSASDWRLRPSLKYDALCLLNALSGDPYYLKYYQAEYDHFHPLFTSEEQAAFARLKEIIKDEGHGIISAKLALYYSAVDDETLPAMIQTAHESAALKAALEKTPYWSAEEWR